MEPVTGPALAGLEPGQLTRIIEDAWYGMGHLYSKSPTVDLVTNSNHLCLRARDGLSSSCELFDINLNGAGVDSAVSEILAEHHNRGKSVNWWLGPNTEPTDLEQRLTARGGETTWVMSAMALDPAAWSAEPVPGAEVVRADNGDPNIHTGLVMFGRSLGSTEAEARPRADNFAAMDCSPGSNLSHFHALVAGRPAASVTVHYNGDQAWVLFVAADERYRGRSLARATMNSALDEAAGRGCRLVVLQATRMGRPLYRRLGFFDYGRLTIVNFPIPGEEGPAGD